MKTTRITPEDSLLVLDATGSPLFELEARSNGVAIIAEDGRRIAWVPISTADGPPGSPPN
jgi:hypothetical protein